MSVVERVVPMSFIQFAGNPYNIPSWNLNGTVNGGPIEGGIPKYGPWLDTFGRHTVGQGEILSHLYSMSSLIPYGTGDSTDMFNQTWTGLRPIQEDLGIPDGTETIASKVTIVSDFLSGGIDSVRARYLVPTVDGENTVYHTNLSGHVESWPSGKLVRAEQVDNYLLSEPYVYPKSKIKFFYSDDGRLLYSVPDDDFAFPNRLNIWGVSTPTDPHHYLHMNNYEESENWDVGVPELYNFGSSVSNIAWTYFDRDQVKSVSYTIDCYGVTSIAYYHMQWDVVHRFWFSLCPLDEYTLDTPIQVNDFLRLRTQSTYTCTQALRKWKTSGGWHDESPTV